MDHVAFMKKSWNLIDRILNGTKTVESRWYRTRRTPWNRIQKGDTIYFKESSAPVTVKAKVEQVLQFEDLTPDKIKQVLALHGKRLGRDTNLIFNVVKNKKYCILVFLKSPARIKPFIIDKTGFGARAAWISVDNIKNIQKQAQAI